DHPSWQLPGSWAGSLVTDPVRLAPDGVWLAAASPRRWWALTPPFHPYHRHLRRERYAAGGLLSVPLSVGFRRLACASILPCGVRTFLDATWRRGHPACMLNSSSAKASSLPAWLPHSGQNTTPARACITNSPQTRHSSEAPRRSADSSWSSVRANWVISVTARGTPLRRRRGCVRAWRRSARATGSRA